MLIRAASQSSSQKKENQVHVSAAKGRPMLSWVGKRPLSRVTAFPAQHIESFDPSGEFVESLSQKSLPPRGGKAGMGVKLTGINPPPQSSPARRSMSSSLKKISLGNDGNLLELLTHASGQISIFIVGDLLFPEMVNDFEPFIR